MSPLSTGRTGIKVVVVVSGLLAFGVAAGTAWLWYRPYWLDEAAIAKLGSADANTRQQAAAWLGERRCARAIPALLAIGHLGNAAAAVVPELTRLLDDADPIVTQMAADALGRMGSHALPTVSWLERLAASRHKAADRAQRALQRIRERPAGFPPRAHVYGLPLLFGHVLGAGG